MDKYSDVFPDDIEIVDSHLADRMESDALQLATRMAEINSRYLSTKRDKNIETELTLLIGGAAVSAAGFQSERRCLAVIGETGAGKSRSIGRAIAARPEFQPRVTGMTETVPILRIKAPRPSTLKLIAEEILDGLGYPLEREIKEGPIWKLVRRQLKARQVRFVHIDEAQHMLNMSDNRAMMRLSDALKVLMEQDDWPVRLILTGMPELADFLTIYRQTARRAHKIHLENLMLPRDEKLVRWIVTTIVEQHAAMKFTFTPDEDFFGRLCHAADKQFGSLTQIVRGAIERVLIDDISGTSVQMGHLVRAYEVFSGCKPDQNIMLPQNLNWSEIQPLNALLREEELAYEQAMEAVEKGERKLHGKHRRRKSKKD